MQLIKRTKEEECSAPRRLEAVRDLGSQLEHLVTRYQRLVRELGATAGGASDLESRVRLAAREVGRLAIAFQALLVSGDEGELSHGLALVRTAEDNQRKKDDGEPEAALA